MFEKYLHFSVILVMFPAVYTGFFPGKIVLVGLFCMVLNAVLLWNFRDKINMNDFDGKNVIRFYVIYLIVEYVRGILFNIDTTRDLFYIFNGFFCLIFFPIWILLARPNYIAVLWKSFMTFGVLISFCLLLYPPTHAMHTMAHNMLWLNVFVLMYPYVKRKYYWLILALSFYIVTYDLNRRSIMLGYLVPLGILLIYPLYRCLPFKKVVFFMIVCIPFVGLIHFNNKTFNVFEYIEESNEEIVIAEDGRAVFTDSRTGIYEDVLNEVFRVDEWWRPFIGLGGNGKVGVSANGEASFGFEGLRESQECGMLNYIQHGGILGMMAYSLLLIVAAYLATFRSYNHFMRMLGLFLLFKFVYSFIEDQLEYSGHVLAQFLWIGMAYNKTFRKMGDKEMKVFIRSKLVIFPIWKTLRGDIYTKPKRIIEKDV